MRYDEARQVIRNGDIIAFKGKWCISHLITFWQKRTFPDLYKGFDDISHVGIALWLKFDFEVEPRLCVIESTGKGVNIFPLSYLLAKYNGVGGALYWLALKKDTGFTGDRVVAEALDTWGCEYPPQYQYLIIMSSWIRWIRGLFGRPLDINPSKYSCSEMVANALMKAGYHNYQEAALTSPIEVCNFSCLNSPIPIDP
jgi:hypothetical protein